MATVAFVSTFTPILDNSGNVLASGKLYFYEVGTTTAKNTYSNSDLTTANANPVVLSAAGIATVFLNGNYDLVIKTSADATVRSLEDINPETTTAAPETNLLPNGSFEDNTATAPDNWTVTDWNTGANVVDSTTQNHGKYSMKFVSIGSGGGYAVNNALLPIVPSSKYSLGFSIKSSAADVRNVVEILWYKADGTASATSSTSLYDDSTTNPTSWTEKWYETTSPADAYYAKVKITGCHSSDATAGSTWFDGVIFTDSAHKRAVNTFSNTVTMSGKSLWTAEGANVASAADCNIWTTDGNTVHVTGTTTISDWGTAPQAGAWKRVIFDGALTLTYNSTTNDLPGDANITTAANDSCIVYARSTSSYQIFDYTPANGRNLGIVSGTAIATTSGTSHDFTGIPSWVKKITISIADIASNGTSPYQVQLGDSGGLETTSYASAGAYVTSTSATGGTSSTSGLLFGAQVGASEVYSGKMEIVLLNAATNLWVASATIAETSGTSTGARMSAGRKALSDTLTQLRFTTVSGAVTFTAGSINILYE